MYGEPSFGERLFPPLSVTVGVVLTTVMLLDCSVPSKRPSFGVASTRTTSPLLGLSGLIIAPVQLVGA